MLNLELQVIDFETKGNVIRLLLGKHTKKYGWVNPEVIEKETNDGIKEYYRSCCSADRPYGDDWDDVPYDCNAGSVYEQFVYDKLDIAFPFDYNIYEPRDIYNGTPNCCYSKDDMLDRKIPALVVVSPESTIYNDIYASNKAFLADDYSNGIYKIYLGDKVDKLLKIKEAIKIN